MTPGFFTRSRDRYSVPHDRIGARWVLVAHLAITRAFEIIREDGIVLTSRLENDITVMLEDVLNNRVMDSGEVDGFDSFFWGIVRRVEVVNFDGTKEAKKPDLCFQLQRENRAWDRLQDALFAECKPVDKKHSLGGHYCAVGKDCTGIERFIIGDYGWAMEEALMIGYVRDGYSIYPHLADALENKKTRSDLGLPTPLSEIEVLSQSGETSRIYRTTHDRRFQWVGGRAATPIDLYHSSHQCG